MFHDLHTWLSGIGLSEHVEAFKRARLDSPGLIASLTDAELKEIGVLPLGDRKRILAAARLLSGDSPDPVPAGPALPSEEITARLPFPLAVSLEKLRGSVRSGEVLEALLSLRDSVELLVRYAVLVLLAAGARSLSRTEQEEVARELVRPALGAWTALLRSLPEKLRPTPLDARFVGPVTSWLAADGGRAAKTLSDFVPFRNDVLGHGARRSPAEYRKFLDEWAGRLTAVVESAAFLCDLVLVRVEDGRLFRWTGPGEPAEGGPAPEDLPEREFGLLREGSFLSLHPFLALLRCPEDLAAQIFVYDSQRRWDRSRRVVTVLEYEGGHRAGFDDLGEALETRWDEAILLAAFRSARARYERIEKDVVPSATLVESLRRGFTGRERILASIGRFLREGDSGIVLVVGPPGTGKSALSARVAQDDPLGAHFFFRREDPLSAEAMVRHFLAHLSRRYEITDTDPVAGPEQARIKLANLLAVLSSSFLAPGEKELLVVDALDEAGGDRERQAAVDALPKRLPKGVFLFTTSRPGDHLAGLRSAARSLVIELGKDDPKGRDELEELEDGAAYLRNRLAAPGINDERWRALARTARGSFLYLRILAEALLAGDLDAAEVFSAPALPADVEDLFASSWKRVRARLGEDEGLQAAVAEVALLLAVSRGPVTAEELRATLDLPAPRVERALRELRPFLDEAPPDEEDPAAGTGWRFHHATLRSMALARTGSSLDVVLGKVRRALDQGRPGAEAAAVALLATLEEKAPLGPKDGDGAASSRPCGSFVRSLLRGATRHDADALLSFASLCEARGFWPRERWLLGRLEALARRKGDSVLDPRRLAELMLRSGNLAIYQARWADARDRLRRAGDGFHALGDEARGCQALYLRGKAEMWAEDYAAARATYAEALARAERLGDAGLRGAILKDVGNLIYLEDEDDLDRALALALEGVALLEASGNGLELCVGHTVAGHVLFWKEDFQGALRHYQRSLDIATTENFLESRLVGLGDVGEILLWVDEPDRARDLLETALLESRRAAHVVGAQQAACALGQLDINCGDLDSARERLGTAVEFAGEARSEEMRIGAVGLLGELELWRGCFDAARAHLEEELRFNERAGEAERQGGDLSGLANCSYEEDALDGARRLAVRAILVEGRGGTSEVARESSCTLGWIELERGRLATARMLAARARRITGDKAIPSLTGEVALLEAAIALRSGDTGRVRELLLPLAEYARAKGFRPLEARARALLAEALLGADPAAAQAEARQARSLFDGCGMAWLAEDASSIEALARAGTATPEEGEAARARAHGEILAASGRLDALGAGRLARRARDRAARAFVT